jgi:hypothetical protein
VINADTRTIDVAGTIFATRVEGMTIDVPIRFVEGAMLGLHDGDEFRTTCDGLVGHYTVQVKQQCLIVTALQHESWQR